MIEEPGSASDLVFHESSSIDAFWNVTLSDDFPFLDCLLLDADSRVQQIDRSELGFLDSEKIDKITNSGLPLVIEVGIVDLTLTWFLVDGGCSCNVLYEYALESLGFQQIYLSLFTMEGLLAINDLITHPCGAFVLTLSIGEGTSHIIITLSILVVQCISTFKCILGMSVLA